MAVRYRSSRSLTLPSVIFKVRDAILVLVPSETLYYEPECSRLPRDEALAKYRKQFDAERIDQVRQDVLRRLAAVASLRDLQSHILDEVVETPATYAETYSVAAGSPFALSHGLAQLSITRPGATLGSLSN